MFTLTSMVGDVWLASDDCKNLKELEYTFIDAYKYYVGRKPRKDTITKFLRNREIVAMNGLDYNFSY